MIGRLGVTLLCLSFLPSCLLLYELGCNSTTASFIRDKSFRRVGNADNNGTWRFDSIITVLDDTHVLPLGDENVTHDVVGTII